MSSFYNFNVIFKLFPLPMFFQALNVAKLQIMKCMLNSAGKKLHIHKSLFIFNKQITRAKTHTRTE